MPWKSPKKAREYNKWYYEQNKERILKDRAQHYLEHREERMEYMQDYYDRNKEKIKAYEREKYHYLKKRA